MGIRKRWGEGGGALPPPGVAHWQGVHEAGKRRKRRCTRVPVNSVTTGRSVTWARVGLGGWEKERRHNNAPCDQSGAAVPQRGRVAAGGGPANKRATNSTGARLPVGTRTQGETVTG